MSTHHQDIAEQGFTVIDHVFSESQLHAIINAIDAADTSRPAFRKTTGLFAVRQFLKEIPGVMPLIFTEQFNALINKLFGEHYFIVKSIYFDKPEGSNWFVACHQDLTISVDRRVEIEGFGPWTAKEDQFAVQPPIDILKNIFTIRIHLDDTDAGNGALKILPGSHKGIRRPETVDRATEMETICPVGRGGIMVMKPLLLHASGRTVDNRKRRVIHMEFSDRELPDPLQWSEYKKRYATQA